MYSLNSANLIGVLGRDPETKPAGSTTVTTVSIATTDKYKDKSEKQVERTDWHNLVLWGKTGENFAKFAKKGNKVYVQGQIRNEVYEQDGVKKYSSKVEVKDFLLLDKKEKNSEPNKETLSQDLPF